MEQSITLGVLVGNRGFFPDHLASSGRDTILKVLAEENIRAIALSENDTTGGSIESLADVSKAVDLFRAHRDEIAGILITLPNFGDERAIANTLRRANLNVPVLVHAFPDEIGKMTIADRRDSFCGKMSVCSNLRQYGIKYTITTRHTVNPTEDSFRADLRRFAGLCRVVGNLRDARVGVIGARPAAFKTVRFSEKLFEHGGISVEPIDLSEILGRAAQLGAADQVVQQKLAALQDYIKHDTIPSDAMLKIAKLGAVIDNWMAEEELQASAIQCWTALQEFYGVVPCTLMSMMSNNLIPCACETDVAGLIGMLAMTLASGKPSAIVDWNNNYGDNPDRAVIFHCSNLPRDLFVDQSIAIEDIPHMDYQAIIANSVGKENTYGTVVGRLRPSPMTYCRVSTDDLNGRITSYLGEGEITDDSLLTFGGYGVIEIPNLQRLLAHICEHGYEHHVAVSPSRVADLLHEAFDKYLGWNVYHHR